MAYKRVLVPLLIFVILGLAVATTVGVFGFLEIFRKQTSSEASTDQVISRQLRGFGALILANIIATCWIILCFGVAGAAATR